MRERKKFKKIHKYECVVTAESFKLTAEAKNPDELTTVKAFYDMNPEKDDRPEHIKIKEKSEAQ